MMASALVAELFVALLQHPRKHHAPALVPAAAASTATNATAAAAAAAAAGSQQLSSDEIDQLTHGMGWLPHQLRGFLESFDTKVLAAHAFDRCPACSPRVVEVRIRVVNTHKNLSSIYALEFLCANVCSSIEFRAAQNRLTSGTVSRWCCGR